VKQFYRTYYVPFKNGNADIGYCDYHRFAINVVHGTREPVDHTFCWEFVCFLSVLILSSTSHVPCEVYRSLSWLVAGIPTNGGGDKLILWASTFSLMMR
jgi:hypothetical protein